jgi:hypothetical protein
VEVLAELLEQVKAFVDRLGQAQLANQQVDSADSASGDGLSLGASPVMDVGRGNHRLKRWFSDRTIKPTANLLLGSSVMTAWNQFHLKSPWVLGH